MNCPVCQSDMVSFDHEDVPLTIKHLGCIYLCQVPVCRCYGGDHVTYQLPKRKDIFDLVCITLAVCDRALTNGEHAFLLNRLHYNNPVYSRHMVIARQDHQCWEDDHYEILPQANYLLNKQIINKLKQPQCDGIDQRPEILRVNLGLGVNEIFDECP